MHLCPNCAIGAYGLRPQQTLVTAITAVTGTGVRLDTGNLSLSNLHVRMS